MVLLLFFLDHFIIFYIFTTKLRTIFHTISINPKKRDLTIESNPEETKEVREGSTKTNNVDDATDDEVFRQSNNTSDIYLRNICMFKKTRSKGSWDN